MDGHHNLGSTTIRDASVRQYEIVQRLNAGGMATVYLGRLIGPHGFSRLVALKSMHPHYAMDANFSAMFVDEARLTALLRHPNIVSTLDVVSTEDSLLLVMEYVEGSSLHALCERASVSGAPIPTRIGCAIIHDLLTGLHHAHEARDRDGRPLGIIHRDVSPQNLMVGRDGLARVLDFGIARARGALHASETGAIRGKVPYMAPEQLCGKPLDRRADIYAAGVMLWEVLTGQRLFHGENMALVSRILTEAIAPPSSVRREVSPQLDAVVMRALTRDPEARFRTAAEMADALSSAVALASRSQLARWGTSDVTLASADAASDPLDDTFAGSATPPTRAFTSPRSRVTTVVALAMIAAFGVVVGARSDLVFTRSAHASTGSAPRVATPAASAPAVVVAPAPQSSADVPPTKIVPATTKTGAREKNDVRSSKSAPKNVARPVRPSAPKPGFESDLGF